MKVDIQPIIGIWDLGYSLDKHTLHSVYTGDNQWGHPEFDTTRSEIGEALFKLKYRFDYNQVSIISTELYESLAKHFSTACLIVPMPPSKIRSRQPVTEIAQSLADKMGIPCNKNLLKKTVLTTQIKDIADREEKVEALVNAFSVVDFLADGKYDILIVDDLFDTGSSLEAATIVLRKYNKIRNIYVATVTRKR